MKKAISLVSVVALPMLVQLCYAQGGDSASKVAHPLGAIPTNLPPEKLYRQFIEPGPAFRGKPFWSWNGRLEQDELIRQIHVMKEMGFGGFFMHSRTGLATEYLGDEWFDLVNACTDEGTKLGMESWLYDEDRWPSGTAGGMVTENPEYRLKFMSCYRTPADKFQWSDDIVAAFACDLKELKYTRCTRINEYTDLDASKDTTILTFKIEEMDKSSFYNGYTYVDAMNRDATDEYIRLTHDQYKERCGDRPGKTLLGVFTDEPHRGAVMMGFGISNENSHWMTPWTQKFAEEFTKRFGYDIIDKLPELFLQKDGRKVSQVKWHYMELTQQLFLENFARPLFDWCQDNNMILTGHVLHEDSLTAQATMQGSLMRFYEFEHWPGVDVLTEGNRNFWIVKQLTSVARQLGQKWLLSELYGCTGWQFNFESHKAVGDWQALFGINVRCPHLSWYTMAGEAKRDYPASIFYQSTWWADYDFIETYYARLGLILLQGKPCCDVLVVNPVESLWCQIHAGWAQNIVTPRSPELKEFEKDYRDIFHFLAGAQIDFDYGDEEMIGRLYRIEKKAPGGPVLWIAKAPYKTVVVPSMVTMRSTTVKILDEFTRAGGKVIFASTPPKYVDAIESDVAIKLASRSIQVAFQRQEIVDACKKNISPAVEILDAATGENLSDVYCQLRTNGETAYLVAMNVNREKWFTGARIRIPAKGYVTEWDCSTGKRYSIAARDRDGYVEVVADFPPSGEHVYIVSPKKNGLAARPAYAEKQRVTYSGPYEYTLSEKNVCVLDLARYRIADGDWQGETEVLKIDQALRRKFHLAIRGGEMVQPWFREKNQSGFEVKGRVTMAFDFHIEQMPEGLVTLCMETPEEFSIKVNDKPLPSSSIRGWWVDNSIERLALPTGLLVRGKNTIQLQTVFHDRINIEAVYLAGDFGVRVENTKKTLTSLPAKLNAGTVTSQGLAFYSGAITYKITVGEKLGVGEKIFIDLPEFEAACVKVNPAGKSPAMIAWQPYRADVTEDVRASGVIELQVVLTRRNTFGPLHLVPMNSGAYGPGHWITAGKAFTNNYQLWPAGLLKAPELVTCAED
jgi:hypothetical protein